MTRLREKVQGHTKQTIGQMIGDDQLVSEDKQQVREAEGENPAAQHSDHGIVKDGMAAEQPKDKERAQTVHKADARDSVSKEETRNPKSGDAKRSGDAKKEARRGQDGASEN